MEINDKYDFLEYVGRQLFLKKFPATKGKVEFNKDKTGKYDLLIRDGESLKYVEIKTVKEIFNCEDYFITQSDWDFLIHQTPVNAKALYVIFDNDNCIVYDLKAIHHLGISYNEIRMLFTRQIHGEGKKPTPVVVLPFSDCYKLKLSKTYRRSGSKQYFDFKLSELNTRVGNGYLTDEYMDEVIKKN